MAEEDLFRQSELEAWYAEMEAIKADAKTLQKRSRDANQRVKELAGGYYKMCHLPFICLNQTIECLIMNHGGRVAEQQWSFVIQNIDWIIERAKETSNLKLES